MTQFKSVPVLIRKIFQTVKSYRMYGPEHPQTQEYLKNLESTVNFHLATGQTFTMVFHGNTLLVDEVVQPARDQAVSFLMESLSARSITSLTIHPGIPFEEIVQVVKILASKPEDTIENGSLKESLIAPFKRVSFNKVRYVAVDEGEKVVAADYVPVTGGTEGGGKSLTRSIDGLTRALERAGFAGMEPPGAPAGAPNVPAKPAVPRTTPELLDYVAERVVPGMTGAWEQLTQIVRDMSPSVRIVLGNAGKSAAPVAIVARQLQAGLDPEVVKTTFQELAPGHWEAMLLFDELAKALQKSGKVLSPESLKKVISFLPHIEDMESSFQGRVLVVECDAEQCSAIRAALTESAYAVETASTAKEAIEKLNLLQEVEAVVLQLALPDKRGTVVVSHLQSTSKKVIPVVIVGDKASIADCDFEVFSYPRKKVIPSQEPKLIAHAVGEFIRKSGAKPDEARKEDMEHAREILKKLVPAAMPRVSGWELEFLHEQAEEGGGDLLDIFKIDNDRLGIILGQISGRGTTATLAMVMVRSTFRLSVTGALAPSELVAKVNRLVTPDMRRGLFVTMMYGCLHVPSGRLSVVNCGLSQPILFDPRDYSAQTPSAHGLPIGLGTVEKFESELRQEDLEIRPGGQVVFHTDGVVEIQNERFAPLTQKPFLEVVKRWGPATANDLLKALETAIKTHRGSVPQTKIDDTTILVVRRTPAGG